MFHTSLKDSDPTLYSLITQEHSRQHSGLELIASENFTSQAVLDCLGSVLTNKYSEGRPDRRYYGGNQVIDKIETLCQDRALEAFRLDPTEWGVCVQPYSGSVANLAAYAGVLQPNDRIMGLALPSGGHLTHGFTTPKKRVSHTGTFYQSMPYTVNQEGWIDYDDLEKRVEMFGPRLLICGGSAYPRDWDYERLREIADRQPAPPLLMCDMAHTSGLIASEVLQSPFPYCDIVTSTTHKTLRGPRSGLIFMKRSLEASIKESVFPGLQGGPHNHQIAGVATALHQTMTPEFREYSRKVVDAARYLAEALQSDNKSDNNYRLMTGGTDNHLILIDLRAITPRITGSKVELVCDWVEMTVNKNAVIGDKSALSPGGIRIGTGAMVSRGLTSREDWTMVATFFDRAVTLAKKFTTKFGTKLRDFKQALSDPESKAEIDTLRNDIREFSQRFDFYSFPRLTQEEDTNRDMYDHL